VKTEEELEKTRFQEKNKRLWLQKYTPNQMPLLIVCGKKKSGETLLSKKEGIQKKETVAAMEELMTLVSVKSRIFTNTMPSRIIQCVLKYGGHFVFFIISCNIIVSYQRDSIAMN
jgi:hypothetical protein